jgi:type II secretory pathway pseudopilin PulG
VAEDGFTLIELLVGMMISIVLLLATLGALDAFNSGVGVNNRLTDAADGARRDVASMVGVLRDAGAPAPTTGAQAATILQAGANDIVFLSTSWPGESGVGTANDVERYCLDIASRTLWFDGLKAGTSGSATPGAACPSTAGGWTSRVVTRNVLNTVANPIFVYGSTNPVRSVSINMSVESGTTLKSRPLLLRSGGTLRGALPPQISVGDVVVGACQGGKALLTLNLAAGGATSGGAKLSAPNAVPVGDGQILVPATGTPANVALTITNLLGLQTLLTKSVSC